MAKNRYIDTTIRDNRNYNTFSLPVYSRGLRAPNLLENVQTLEYVYKVGDRLDIIAAKYYGEEEYWWVIALCNGITYPFASGGLTPGKTLKIPLDVKDIFEKIFK